MENNDNKKGSMKPAENVGGSPTTEGGLPQAEGGSPTDSGQTKGKQPDKPEECTTGNDNGNTMQILTTFKNEIIDRQEILVFIQIVLLFIIAGIVWVLLGEVSFLTEVSITRFGGVVLLWLLLGGSFYCTFHVIKRYHRNQDAIRKINILILKIKLNTDKDLLKSGRLDRELEMICRILES